MTSAAVYFSPLTVAAVAVLGMMLDFQMTAAMAITRNTPYGYENSLMAHIRRIREKIEENPSKPVSLITVKGLGYKLVLEG